MAGGEAGDAAAVVQAVLDAREVGDESARRALISPDVVYINTGFAPFELRGRDAYLRFIDSLHDIYTAPRVDEFMGIEGLSPTLAALKGRVTIGDVNAVAVLFHYVYDGVVTEIIDVFEDRGRRVASMIDPVALANAMQEEG